MKKLICVVLALVMIMAMVACADENKEAYEAAVATYNAGDYKAASEMLTALGEYEDAAQLLATIKTEVTGKTVTVTTAQGATTTEVEYVFQDGNIVKENVTHADGTVTKNYYKYDDNGLCTSETLNQADGSKIVINHLFEEGKKVRSIRTNANKSKDTYVYTCDENGKILSHVLTLADGTVEVATYNYNENGLLANITAGNTINSFTYNDKGEVTVEYLVVDGVDTSMTAYEYNCNYFVD